MIRISTGFPSLNELLGGGLMPGTGYVFASAPGLGKTTLVLQMLDAAARAGNEVMLASAEQSTKDLTLFARRVIAVDQSNIALLGDESYGGDIYEIVDEAERRKVRVLAVDSLQTVVVDDIKEDAGSSEQQKAALNYLTSFAAAKKLVVICIAHLDREGKLSPTVETFANHIAGTICWIKMPRCTCGAMDGLDSLRVVTADRNKYGPSGERGTKKAVLAMTESGFRDGLII